MYKGRRDPDVDIIIKQELCNEYISKDGTAYVEIFIPRSEGSRYTWGTIMVRPEQVYAVDDEYNLIRVNNFAGIINSTKEQITRKVLDSERMTPYDIIGVSLKHELQSPYPASSLLTHYQESGLTMYQYILRNKPSS